MDKTRKNRMTRLSTMLDGMVAPSVRKRGFVMSRLVSEWPAIAGDIAGWSRPSRLELQRDGGGKLTVAIRSGFGPLALQMRDSLADRVNAAFGYRAVSEIIFVQTLPPQPATPMTPDTHAQTARHDVWALDSKLEKVKSPEIRAALRRLGTPLEKDD